jgi:hypothetical protein
MQRCRGADERRVIWEQSRVQGGIWSSWLACAVGLDCFWYMHRGYLTAEKG